jgi:hypothetical protein
MLDLIKGVFAVPKNHPTLASVLSGVVALALVIGGLSVLSYQPGSAFLLLIPGLALLAFVVYAAYDTRGFQQWSSSTLGHALSRWVGPIALAAALVVALFSVIIVVFIIIALVAAFANS